MQRHQQNIANHRRPSNRGVTLIESVFVLSVLLLILLTILDLGLAVLKYNTLSSAARRTAREAIVHGKKAALKRSAWGPETYDADAADTSEPAATVRAALAAIPPEDVSVLIEWPDGDNRVDQRVRVTLTYRYEPIVPLPFADYFDLQSISTMRIAH